jgi:hypothetical protein
VLDGSWHEAGGQRFLVVERAYRAGHRHGRVTVSEGLPPPGGLWPTLDLLSRTPCQPGALFLDLETTGLMGGAGTHAFLVGCGWFEGGTFRVRQYLMTAAAGERALLGAVADLVKATGTVVTYNGKSFDVPLIETRYLFHRLTSPFDGMPHVDMLHPARRLWRPLAEETRASRWDDEPAESPCRLSALERTLCGFEREGDVPGFEIPARYFHFVRSGDAKPLEGVLEHNRLDLLSLALVTAHTCQLLDDGPSASCSARELLGLGRVFDGNGRHDQAAECFARAGGLRHETTQATSVVVQAEALRGYAVLARRARRFEDAAAAWRRMLELPRVPAPLAREASEALAVHYEHRARDLAKAKSLALRALDVDGSGARRAAIDHRVARLDRKLGLTTDTASLFFG